MTISGTTTGGDDATDPPAVTLTITDDDDPVSIPDDSLRAVVEDSLNKASRATITREEMATLTRLVVANKTIRDLTGLEFATGLDTRDLGGNRISDLSPLVSNSGLGRGDRVDVQGNPLNASSRTTHIPTL